MESYDMYRNELKDRGRTATMLIITISLFNSKLVLLLFTAKIDSALFWLFSKMQRLFAYIPL